MKFIAALESFRSLGFGAMLGSGGLCLVYALIPQTFANNLTLDQIAFIGALIGGGAHLLIDKWLLLGLLKPIGRIVIFYSRMIEILMLRQVIGQRKALQLARTLADDYFLGRSE